MTSGNESLRKETGASVDRKIRDGVTTKAQVRAMFGDPMSVRFTDSGHEEWMYAFEASSSDAVNYIPVANMFHEGTHGTRKQLTVIFTHAPVDTSAALAPTTETLNERALAGPAPTDVNAGVKAGSGRGGSENDVVWHHALTSAPVSTQSGIL